MSPLPPDPSHDLDELLRMATNVTPRAPWWCRGKLDRALVHHLLESRAWDYLTLVILGYLALMLGVGAFQDLEARNWFEGILVLAFYLVVLLTFAVNAIRLRRKP